MTQNVREQFLEITQKALRRFLNEQVNSRLKSALEVTDRGEITDDVEEIAIEEVELPEGVVREDKVRGIVTTEEEIEAYFVVKSILRDVIDIRRVHMRDAKSYCNVLLDDSNRKPIFRMRFNRAQNYIGLFDKEKREEKIPIEDVDKIYKYGDRIIAAVKLYDSTMGVPTPSKTIAKTIPSKRRESYTGKKVYAFNFRGERYVVTSWKEAMMTILELLRSYDQKSFEENAVTMAGRKRPYLTYEQDELRFAQLVPNTNLYVETNLSSNMIAGLCYGLTEKMGISPDELTFETD